MEQFLANIPAWIHILTLIVTAAAAITAMTPNPKDDEVVSLIMRILNVVAFNWGGAKNDADNGITKKKK